MGYYAGGYYAGGYYAGGIFGTIGRAVKGIAKVGFGALTGGPIGGLKAAVGVAKENIMTETLMAGGSESALTPELKMKHDMALARGGASGGSPKPGTAIMLAPGAGTGLMLMPGMGGMLPRGYRLNKSAYATRGGGTSRWPAGLMFHPKHTELVKQRRMNWGNGRALVRAERRIGSFLRHATKYIRWAHPGKKGKAYPAGLSKRRKK